MFVNIIRIGYILYCRANVIFTMRDCDWQVAYTRLVTHFMGLRLGGRNDTGTVIEHGILDAGTVVGRGILDAGTVVGRGILDAGTVVGRGILDAPFRQFVNGIDEPIVY